MAQSESYYFKSETCIIAVKSIGDRPWRWNMLYALICDGMSKEKSV